VDKHRLQELTAKTVPVVELDRKFMPELGSQQRWRITASYIVKE
jgi:hypothetical protein